MTQSRASKLARFACSCAAVSELGRPQVGIWIRSALSTLRVCSFCAYASILAKLISKPLVRFIASVCTSLSSHWSLSVNVRNNVMKIYLEEECAFAVFRFFKILIFSRGLPRMRYKKLLVYFVRQLTFPYVSADVYQWGDPTIFFLERPLSHSRALHSVP